MSFCPRFHHAVELVGRRWTGAILRVLMSGPARFNAVAASIPEISDRMLSERLRELESEKIVARIVIPETPVRVEYELTEKGRALEAALAAIAEWAERWIDPSVVDNTSSDAGRDQSDPPSGAINPDITATASRH